MRVHTSKLRHMGIAVAVLSVVAPIALLGPGDASASSVVRTTATTRSSTPKVGICKSSITLCALKVLAPAGGTEGVYLKQVGGSVLASWNPSYPFEPASSIKAVIALYALTQVMGGALAMTTPIPEISTAGGTEDCPPATIVGTEPLGTALQQMLQVSDNNRTRELMQYFGVGALNTFVTSLGMTSTHFQTSLLTPGFNVIGCDSYPGSALPPSLDGNTMSLSDLGILWSKIAALPAPFSSAFYALAAGREMSNSMGYDFTGIWPGVVKLVRAVAPTGMSSALVTSFIDHSQVSVKGGSYEWHICQSGAKCERAWASFAFVAYFPSCARASLRQTEYVGSDFVSASDTAYASTPVAYNVTGPAIMALLRSPVTSAMKNWKLCAPKQLPVLVVHGSTMRSSRTVGVGATLATITDTASSDTAADMVATISWGDGTRSVATISGGRGTFQVHGWHSFPTGGVHTLTIIVKSEATGVSTLGYTRLEVA